MRALLFSMLLPSLAVLPACRACGEDGAPVSEASRPDGGDPIDRAALPDREVTCPVCGLTFHAKEAVATRTHGGATYYFLLEDHARAFADDPSAYLPPHK